MKILLSLLLLFPVFAVAQVPNDVKDTALSENFDYLYQQIVVKQNSSAGGTCSCSDVHWDGRADTLDAAIGRASLGLGTLATRSSIGLAECTFVPALAADVSASTLTLAAQINAVAASTGALATQTATLSISTTTLRDDLKAALAIIAIDTNTLHSEQISPARVNMSTITAQFDTVALATGTLHTENIDTSRINLSTVASKGLEILTTGPLYGGGDLSTNRTFYISSASVLTDGYLKATDWSIFNGKLSVDGDGSGLSGVALATRTLTAIAPLTGGGTFSGNINIGISAANDLADGYLTSDDWNTFNNKLAYNGSGTSLSGIVKLSGANMTGQMTTASTMTVQGNAFSVGISTFIVTGGGAGLGISWPGGSNDNHGGKLRVYSSTASDGGTWSGRIVSGGPTANVVLGELNGRATIGGHNSALDSWSSLAIHGSTYAAAVPAGYIGEVLIATAAVTNSCGASGAWYDVASRSITPGVWDLTILAETRNGTAVSFIAFGYSTTSGNSAPGTYGLDQFAFLPAGTSTDSTISMPPVRIALNSTTTYYFKGICVYSSAPSMGGWIRATRVY